MPRRGILAFEELSARPGLIPPAPDGLFVVGHEGILQGGESVLKGIDGLDERPAVVAEDGGPQVGIGGGHPSAVAEGARGQG